MLVCYADVDGGLVEIPIGLSSELAGVLLLTRTKC